MAMRGVKALLGMHDDILDKRETLWDLFQTKMMNKGTLPQFKAYINQLDYGGHSASKIIRDARICEIPKVSVVTSKLFSK